MATMTKIVAHDGITEWADCSQCGTHLDGAGLEAPKDWDGSCWVCGAPASLVGLRVPLHDPRSFLLSARK